MPKSDGIVFPLTRHAKLEGWAEAPTPAELKSVLPPGAQTFRHKVYQLAAIRSREDGRWHLSVSHANRIPTWGELGFARDNLLPPETWMMVPHPPREYWMNFDSRVLHLYEFRDEQLIAMLRETGEEAKVLGFNNPDDGVNHARR